jgi:tRNA (guanine37-N1)-methyltransferase
VKFTVVTILPELIEPALTAGVVGRAREAGTITVATVNPRDFTTDRHRTVDDTPYGGGPGMVMKPEPLLAAIEAAAGDGPRHRVYLSPAGAPLTQARVRALAQHPHLVLVCGRYEGVDERVVEEAIDEELSIGDYVLSGGELAALVVIDAVARLVPGVLGEATSADDESHSAGLLEYPQYTRPPVIRDRAVPPILLGGNHAAIATWRRARAVERTARRRPDLFARLSHDTVDRKVWRELEVAGVPLAARTHIALVHHPVFDRTGKIVTTSLTNFDIHDIARSTRTYGLAAYHIVTPITQQREKADYIAGLWLEENRSEDRAPTQATTSPTSTASLAAPGARPARTPPVTGSRAGALALVRTADAIDTVIAELSAEYGRAPQVVATSARPTSFPQAIRSTPEELRAAATFDPAPLLILLGTGWGLCDHLIPQVSRMLTPIEGGSDWNHLSVRSAAAILLDRLFGRAT